MPTFDVDLLVLGGGAAGLTASGVAANLGAKTMMVERDRLGGDCTWTGCIPSKTLLHAAALRAEAEAFRAFAEGGREAAPAVPAADFPAIMAHVRRVREEVYADADDPAIFEGFGVEVVTGEARLIDAHAAEITLADGPGGEAGGSRRVTFRMAVLCTGSRPAVPPIPGLESVPHLTNHSLFEITEQPEHLVILGAGPIGCEMAQAFRRLGSRVTVIDRSDRVLGRDDADHAAVVQAALEREGVRFVLGASVERAEGGVRLTLGSGEAVEGSHLLVAVGRQPNVDGLGLDAAGVAYTPKGIRVDKTGRTSVRHIFAAGDCTGEFALTHMSEHTAKQAVTTALLKLPATIDRDGLTWATFTDPEIAQLGPTEAELNKAGTRFTTYRFPYTKVDRAITEGRAEGNVKVHASPVTGKILGASAVGARAGEVVALYAVARKAGGSVKSVSDTIIAYPTYALAARRAADQFYVQKQFPLAIDAVKRVFGYRGQTPPPPDPDRVV